MKTLRRTIHPQVRVLDAAAGLVEYVASDESIDSYNEIVRADGARFDRFQKNAPFVDSHNYESIDCLLGQVVDFRVANRRVIETVKWAIDVPSNLLAEKGFQMTQAGYLKAVSIGFIPLDMVSKWDNNPQDFSAALEDLNLPSSADVRTIYLSWEQLELSACVIGANANAVAQIEKAYQDGILNDSDIGVFSKMSKDFAQAFQLRHRRARSYSPPPATQADPVASMIKVLGGNPSQPTTPMKKNPSIPNFNSPSSEQLSRETKAAFEKLEAVRRNGTETDLERAVRRAFAAVGQERHASYGNPISRYLERNPERRYFWNGVVRSAMGTLRGGTMEAEAVKAALGGTTSLSDYSKRHWETKAADGFDLQSTLGAGLLLAIPVFDEVWDLLLHYGAYKYLGLRKMIGQYTRYVKATGFPQAIFITPNQQGITTIPVDNSLMGASVTATANTIAALIQASREWIQDEKVDLSEVIFSKFVMGLAARIDWGCFQGNGNDDITNGMTKGIFFDPAIATVQAAAGAGTVPQLQRTDFINVIAAVAPAGLQRMDTQPPRWYISPVLIPQLLTLWDGEAHNYLLKTPAETGGEWLLLGFPVTWAAQAPSAVAAGAKVAAFGNPDAYLVALHEDFEITKSEGGGEFSLNAVNFRALGRGQSMLREPTGFATLSLA